MDDVQADEVTNQAALHLILPAMSQGGVEYLHTSTHPLVRNTAPITGV